MKNHPIASNTMVGKQKQSYLKRACSLLLLLIVLAGTSVGTSVTLTSCKGAKTENKETDSKSLPRSTAEAEKVSQEAIDKYFEAVKESGQDLHSLMIVRNGKVVAEQWFGDNAPDKLHVLNSVSKTYTATAVGFAVAEKLLTVNDKVISFFPDKLPAEVSPDLEELSVYHLLTMTAGVDMNKLNQVRRSDVDDWVEGFLAAPFEYKP